MDFDVAYINDRHLVAKCALHPCFGNWRYCLLLKDLVLLSVKCTFITVKRRQRALNSKYFDFHIDFVRVAKLKHT